MLMPMISALLSLLGCWGTEPRLSPPMTEAQSDDGTPRLQCPDGTEQQSGTTESGEEYWCARAGVMHGPFVSYYASGKKEASGYFIENQRSGQWTWKYENEQTRMKGKYDRGKQIGSWRWWHQNSNRQMEGDYLHGRKQGQWTTFFESGNKESEGMYHNDNKSEVWSYFGDDDTSAVTKVERYENGELAEERVR